MVGKSWADELKNGTIITVSITQKGLWVVSNAMQSWRGPCLMGGTKESTTEALQQYKVGKAMTSGIVNVLSPRERVLPSQHSPAIMQKGGRANLI